MSPSPETPRVLEVSDEEADDAFDALSSSLTSSTRGVSGDGDTSGRLGSRLIGRW